MNGAHKAAARNAFPLKSPASKRELVGGDLLAQSLHALGVRVAFGIHGGHLDSFLIGCHEIGIRLVDTRHETVSVQAAEGYAKVSGNVGVSFITANSGFSNGLPGLASAFADRSPIFVVTSSPPLRDAETNPLQGFHQQDVVAKPLTKFAHRVTNVEEIPRLVSQGFRTAMASPPGPVLIDFPIDVLFTPPRQHDIAWGSIAMPLPYPPGPHPQAIKKALEMLKESERPCVITGTGARGDETGKQLRKFVEATGVPLFNGTKYGGILPLDHPQHGGPSGNLAKLAATGDKQPDLCILVGARTGFLLGGRTGAILPNDGSKLVQIDVDGSEIGRSHAVDLGIVSDAGLAIAALNDELSAVGPIRVSAEWTNKAVGLNHMRPKEEDEPLEMAPGRQHPYHAIKSVFRALEPGAIVITDGGESGCWSQSLVDQHARAHRYLHSTGYLGFLGNGWGYSLGAAIAEPERQIVNMQGDGSGGLHLAELDTFARHGLKVLTVICNNYCWNMSQSGQELVYGEYTDARPATALSPDCAYEIVAQGFGCAGERVDRCEDVAAAVKRLSGKAACLNLIISDKPIVAATLSMVGKPEGKAAENVIVVPYYDNLPRPFYKT